MTPTCVPFVDLARQHAPLAPEFRAVFDRLLDESSFILGLEVERFESDFADYCGTDHCVGVGSGTAALTIMLLAAGIGRGDQVIVPAHTFIATALSVLHAGAMPVCVDVDARTGLLDPEAVRAAIGPATSAVIAVHLYGQVCDMDMLRAIAAHHGLAIFEDAAQAHGASYRGQRAGCLGDAAAFSFYPSKNLGALGDGGAICTRDPDLAARARELRDVGRGATNDHRVIGYNERLDGLQAALLRVKLSYLDGWNLERRALATEYRARLRGAIDLPEEPLESSSAHHLFAVRVSDRDSLKERLAVRGIATGIHYPTALVDQPALRGAARVTEAPVARDWAARELSLPLFPGLSAAELDAVIEETNGFVADKAGLRLHREAEIC